MRTKSIAFLIFFLWFFPSLTSASISFHLLKKSIDTEKNILINNGGAVLNKSQVRGLLEVEKAGRLSVKFVSSSGKEAKIVDNQEVPENSSISLPSDKDWYELDDIPGQSKFLITLTTTTGDEQNIEFTFNQIPLSIGVKDYASNLNKNINKPQSSTTNLKTVIPAKGAIPSWLDNSLEVTSKIKPDATLNVRGKVGASIYKEFSGSVVLVATDEGFGTGSIIDDKGTVLTNWHVIADYETVAVIFKPPLGGNFQESDIFKAKVVKFNEITDLAMLQLVSPPKGVKPIPLGTLQDIEIGADVHAIGHPTGESWSYTQGTISQLRPDYEWQTDNIGKHKATVVQTQTPINPGNSGGPLLTDNKKLIGVNSFINPEAQGLNYAVSIKDVHEFVNSKQSRFFTKDESSCEPVSEILDSEEYKNTIATGIDTDCDNIIDTITIDEDLDGVIDMILSDPNKDGYPEILITRSEEGGPLNLWLIDKDGDQEPDVAGIDDDMDFEPDRFVELNK